MYQEIAIFFMLLFLDCYRKRKDHDCPNNDHEYSESNPNSVLRKSGEMFNAGCYEASLQILDIPGLHLVLPAEYTW